ncbi:MAG TPA: FliM/FliN family flagellar motor switch protein, partial [Steroidobacteraceae bacterium]
DGADDSRPTIVRSAWPFLGSVKVRLAVRIGGAEVSVADLMGFKEGSLVELDQLVDEPLEVMIDGHVVARGTLVAVGDHFGVRISEAIVASPVVARA